MKRNAVEWVGLGISVAALAVLVGLLVVDAVSGGDEPPQPAVTLRLDEAYEAPNAFLIPATVRNSGDLSAESVLVEATATVAGNEEISPQEIDFLAAESEVEITFGFSGRPEGEVGVRVVGFRQP